MSIVSGLNDMMKVSVKKQPTNAVQWGQDVVPDVLNAPQLPTINQFRKIRVPSGNPRPAPKGCDIPVKFKQENDVYARDDTEMFECTKLPLAPMKTSKMDFSMLLNEQTQTTNPPFDYNSGIRPSLRAIKFDAISEPTGQMFRP